MTTATLESDDPLRIEDYALIGNTQTCALVGRDGSIDWMCIPRFDSPACFASLLGDVDNGRWLIAPDAKVHSVRRRYRENTLVLETVFETARGSVRVVDFMPTWPGRTDVVRIVEGIRGRVPMRMELVLRFGYGAVVPWVRRDDGVLLATGGPLSIEVRSSAVEMQGKDFRTCAEFSVGRGERVPFVITCFPSHETRPLPIDPLTALDVTEREWKRWADKCTYKGKWEEEVMTSLIALKALIHAPTGGIVAAATTSLPEWIGGVRNWDYRYCWVRDATFTLYALLLAGYRSEAEAWREWLLRSAAGRPQDLQVLYGVDGERTRNEYEAPWLAGYEGSAPVRIGNAAAQQFQLDVYGELIDTLSLARNAELAVRPDAWQFQRKLLDWLETSWEQPDHGIWEMRGEPQHFTHSKVMAWVAFDRSIHDAERCGLEGPVQRWRKVRRRIHTDICRKGYDAERGTFVQHYGTTEVDASLLLLPIVGFLPPDDPRILGTIEAVKKDLMTGGLVSRYRTKSRVDGLPPGEGKFLPCSFWLADALAMAGKHAEAVALFERLLKLRNDVGLLAEEYDPAARRQLGNFPQALTHVALVNTARNLSSPGGPAQHHSSGMATKPPGADDADGDAPPPPAKPSSGAASSALSGAGRPGRKRKAVVR